MEITENLIKTLYKRAMQYCVAKYGSEADELELLDDGSLMASYIDYCCDDRDVKIYTITYECLTEDLDKVYEERKQQEEEARIEREAQRAKQQKLNEERKKRERKLEYEKLKKEFES